MHRRKCGSLKKSRDAQTPKVEMQDVSHTSPGHADPEVEMQDVASELYVDDIEIQKTPEVEMQGVSHYSPGHADTENRYDSLLQRNHGDHVYEITDSQKQSNKTTRVASELYVDDIEIQKTPEVEMQGVSHYSPGHADTENRYDSLLQRNHGDHVYEITDSQMPSNKTTRVESELYVDDIQIQNQ